MEISFAGRTLSLESPKIMGILNFTPDSFSDGGLWNSNEKAFDHAADMISQGADIIDIGGESTRPGAQKVSVQEEMERIIPVIEKISKNLDTMISVDTSQPEVITEAVKAGAHIWNDIRALQLEGALNTAVSLQIPVILMHMQGTPQTMQINPRYGNVVQEVCDFLMNRVDSALACGVKNDKIILDPGFGFGKSAKDNFALLKHLDKIVSLGYPVLSALSRKTMIKDACGINDPKERITGSVSGAVISFMKGARMVRVHDVKPTFEALQVFRAMQQAD